MVAALLVFTVLRKLSADADNLISVYTFYLSRLFILIFSLLIFSYFHYSERSMMVINSLIGLMILLLFDPIHNLFGVGYFQLGFQDPDYYYTNVLFFFLYLMIAASFGIIKNYLDSYVTKNEELIYTLNIKNDLIELQRKEIETQNKELQNQNYSLESAVEDRTETVRKQFLQLEQFSFITAHNLRGPVARIIGLFNIIDKSSITARPTLEALNHMVTAAHDLDEIIGDLGSILSIQKGEEPEKVAISLDSFIQKIENRHIEPLEDLEFSIEKSILIKSIKSVPAYLDSILTNLFTNAIKYRSKDEPCVISIKINKEGGNYKITFKDNGIGFDSEKYNDKLFQPFQRFNLFEEGKGLGLFLIKTQVTALKGKVSLMSTEGNGTIVEIILPLE